MAQEQQDDVITQTVSLRYDYSLGDVAKRFMQGLREKKLLATRCSRSGFVYLPPRAYCERSFELCDSWVEAGTEGVIEQSTIDFRGLPGKRQPPVAFGYVRLDGIDTAIVNYIENVDMSDIGAALKSIAPGTRVRVQFAEEPKGTISDFVFVRVEPSSGTPGASGAA
jgi:uncharacterized protein